MEASLNKPGTQVCPRRELPEKPQSKLALCSFSRWHVFHFSANVVAIASFYLCRNKQLHRKNKHDDRRISSPFAKYACMAMEYHPHFIFHLHGYSHQNDPVTPCT